MSKVTLYSLLGTPIAYPSASFTAPDMRSNAGLYAFGDSVTAVVTSLGRLELSDQLCQVVELSDQLATTVEVSDG